MSHNPFHGQAARTYADGPPRQVPGYASLHRMRSLLLAERMPPHGKVLVLGAGGGQELKALAEANPGWYFDGIDPSPDMLRVAAEVTDAHAARIRLITGKIDAAPVGPYDAATAILVFRFIPLEERLQTLKQIRRRLRAGSPFICVHLSFAQSEPERSLWIARHVAFGQSNGLDEMQAESARSAIAENLTILDPTADVADLKNAGFADVRLFYAGLSLRGWIAYAS